jgi:hypothetical protein
MKVLSTILAVLILLTVAIVMLFLFIAPAVFDNKLWWLGSIVAVLFLIGISYSLYNIKVI